MTVSLKKRFNCSGNLLSLMKYLIRNDLNIISKTLPISKKLIVLKSLLKGRNNHIERQMKMQLNISKQNVKNFFEKKTGKK